MFVLSEKSVANERMFSKMSYVIRVGSDYIAEGKSYTVQGESFVPFTGRFEDAKKYKTYKMAERASKRSGENMRGEISIIEVE